MSTLKKNSKWLLDPFVFRMVNAVIFIFYFVPSDYNIENIPMKISFVWGIVLLVWDFFTKRVMFKQSYWYILLILCFSYLFSIATNYPESFLDNAYNFVYLATTVFLFYPVDADINNIKLKKQVKVFNEIVIGLTFILAVISFFTFVFNISYIVPTGTPGVMARQGFLENRLFGLYTSPNMGSMFGYVSVFLMMINNHLKRGNWKKFQPFYIVNAIVQYLYFILSSSRGTQIAILAFMIFVYLIWTYKIIASRKNVMRKVAKNFIFLSVSFFGVLFLNGVIENGLSYIPSTVTYFTSSPQEETIVDESGKEVIISKRPPIERISIQHSEEGKEVSSGRLTIWKAGLKLVQQKPIFGVADSDVYRSGKLSSQLDVKKLTPVDEHELQRAHGNMHSTYVAVLVKSGIAGFIILTIFVLLILKDTIQFLGNEKFDYRKGESQLFIITFAFLLSLFVNDVVENHILFNNRDVMGLVFWTYLGLINYYRKNVTKKWISENKQKGEEI